MAHTLTDIKEEDRNTLLSSLNNLVDSVYQESSGSRDFVDNMQMVVNDESPAQPVPDITVQPTYADGTPKSRDFMQQEQAMRQEFERTRSRQTSPPITQQDLNNIPEQFAQYRRRAARQPYHAPVNEYKSNTYIDAGGVEKKSSVHTENINWNELSRKPAENLSDKLDRLKSYVTHHVLKVFGSGNIKEIVIDDEQLLINGVMLRLNAPPDNYDSDLFPMDTSQYLARGLLANFFDYSALRKMRNLKSLAISDKNFYVSTVADDLGLSRRIGVSSVFRIVPSLQYFRLGSESVTRDSIHKPESLAIKSVVKTAKRGLELADKMRIGLLSCTDSIQSACVNDFKQYVSSRGNKPLIVYCLGVTFRGWMTAKVACTNLKVHVVTGIAKGVVDAFKSVASDRGEE